MGGNRSGCHLGEYDPYEGKYCPGDEDTGGHKDGRLRTRRCSIARMLEDVDFMFGYAAATYEEAHVLREAGVKKPILILGYTFPYCYEEMIGKRSARQCIAGIPWKNWQRPQQRPVRKPKCISKWIPAWEGIGITPDDEGLDFVKFVMEHPGLEVEGIFTHFAKSDEAE